MWLRFSDFFPFFNLLWPVDGRMAFLIRFYTDCLAKPVFGHVIFDSGEDLGKTWRSKSMEGPPSEASAELPILSKSADFDPNVDAKKSVKEATTDEVVFFSGNPEIEVSKGVLRLFKDNKTEKGLENGLPRKRSDLVCLLAVPAHYSSAEICTFLRSYARFATYMRVLRDQSPDRVLLVLKMVSQEKADDFFLEFNGARFNSVEPERCKVAFLSGVEFLEPRDAELLPPLNQHEMPTCPVCLERLEEQASGIFVTLCNHSFHCSCLAQWNSDSSCPVCRYTLQKGVQDEQTNKCDDCDTSDSLWICLICGHVGCSRYRQMHAQEHWKQTGHTYSLELDSQRVWDYAGDGYVHRLIQNKTDGKVVELPSPFQTTDYREPEKIQKIVTEYNFLLTSQLEAQRVYFEDMLHKALSEKTAPPCNHERERREAASLSTQMDQLKGKMLDLMRENKFLKDINSALESDRGRWEIALKKQQQEALQKQEEMSGKVKELEEQVRDLMFFVEGQKVLGEKGDLDDGDVVKIRKEGVPPPPMTKRPGKGNRKKK